MQLAARQVAAAPLAQPARQRSRRGAAAPPRAAKGGKPEPENVSYGNDWYETTKRLSKRNAQRTTREALDEYRAANTRANNGKERKDLYSDNWDGDVYKGSGFNILTLVVTAFVLTPVLGLAFAYWSYGTLWG